MAFGWDDAIGIGGSLLAGALNLSAQQGQQANQRGSLQLAMQNYLLQKQALDQQYELATAGTTDARGNQTRYVPGRGWVVDTTPQTKSLINRSDAVQGMNMAESLGRGADERRSAFNRRINEGSAASPLLDAIRYGYGAPSREGVIGASKIADVTGSTEAADQARSGYTAAALRTGTGAVPLGNTINSLDRGATAGVRSALARNDANGSSLYNSMKDQWMQSNANPYNMLATRASNVENIPFAPENLSASLDSNLAARGPAAAGALGRGAANMNSATTPLMAAMLGQRTPNYDTFVGNLTDMAKKIPGWFNGGASPATPDSGNWWKTSSSGDGFY